MLIGQQIAEALTEQFYRWELRGRGWAICPNAVQLEPPFRPFEGHYLPPELIEDDGRIESPGSLFAGKLSRFLGFNHPPLPPPVLEEIEEPENEPAGSAEGLVELQIALPPDYQPLGNVFEQFLFSIGYARGPIAFEVVGTAKELVVQITTWVEDSEPVRRQLRAFFPEAVILSIRNYLPTILQQETGRWQIVDFGLEREFMIPINNLKALAVDPLVSMCGAMDRLGVSEGGLFQVLLEPARQPWATSMVRAVCLADGKPFFNNDSELVSQARSKAARPIYAVAVRVAVRGANRPRSMELLKALSGALRPMGNPVGNQLVPLNDEGYSNIDRIADLAFRQSRRPGMLLNSDELIALAHLPTAAVRAKSLRRVLRPTKPAPDALTRKNNGVCAGINEHEGVNQEVWLPHSVRLNHCHILGATGSGKSTLLSQIALQDILLGHGVAVVDPHGDLIDLLIPHIPPERMKDVVLFDPTDPEYAIAFNPLAAASDLERDLLATDFIAVMKQHTSSWGDQMSSLLGNAVLAFLCSSKGGTLPELRRFLSDPKFRAEFLKTVTNSEVVYYWTHEAALANKSSIGSILTRLDSLLRYESLLHILGQRANRLDFANIMDSGKIFLARLAKGLIGKENAFLLGSLLVSRFYQTTIARQARSREDRRPFFLMMDEAADLLTSTVSEILKGTRKYGLGLTLAHQTLDQLRRDEEVYGAVTGNCGVKVCFQVGGDDARKMAEEFGGFQATDLMNLPSRSAIARVGPRDDAFNLEVGFIPEPERPMEDAYADVLAETRKRYCTPRSEIRAELAELRKGLSPESRKDPFAELEAKRKAATKTEAAAQPEQSDSSAKKPETTIPAQAKPSTEPTDGDRAKESPESERGLDQAKAESIKNQIIQASGSWGFSYKTEKPVNQGTGRVDVVLTLGELVIACEISATTRAEHEFERNIKKCLQAGYERIFLVCNAPKRREKIQKMVETECHADEQRRVACVSVDEFLGCLSRLASDHQKKQAGSNVNPKSKQATTGLDVSDDEREKATKKIWEDLQRRMKKDRGERE
jgi:hypothetical protein